MTQIRSPRRDEEHQEQSMLFQWAELAKGRYPELGLLFAIPNFAGRLGNATKRHGARLKAEGRKKGVPDCCLPVARHGYHALYLEMKAKDGRARPEQLEWLSALNGQGNKAVLCVGWEEARDTLVEYLTPAVPRARVA